MVNSLPPSDAVSETEKITSEDLFGSVLLQLKNINPLET